MPIPFRLTKLFKGKVYPALIVITLIGISVSYAITLSFDVNMTAMSQYVRNIYNTSIVSNVDSLSDMTLNRNNSLENFMANPTVLKKMRVQKTSSTSNTTSHVITAATSPATPNCSTNNNSSTCGTAEGYTPRPLAPEVQRADNVCQNLYMTTTFRGRLGNQMSIYAALLGIARANNNRRAFIRSGSLLDGNFAIKHTDNSLSTHGWKTIHHENHAQFYPSFFNLPKLNITLWGYFFSWKFFEHVQDEIRKEFTFHSNVLKRRDQFFRDLKKQKGDVIFVGVHVRRGDFLAERHQKAGFGVPQVSYYVKAFQTMRRLLSNSSLLFVVASDDLRWCEDNLKASDVFILSKGSPGYHLAILADCDHSVISGGSYSWWAAWLANGTTIYFEGYPAPGSLLSQGFVRSDVYPPDWIPQNN